MSIEGTAKTEYASLSGKIHTFVVDKTLTISGACADAQATGEAIETAVDSLKEETAEYATEKAVESVQAMAGEVAREAAVAAVAEEVQKAVEDFVVLSAEEVRDICVNNEGEASEKFLTGAGLGELWSLVEEEAVSHVGDTIRTYRTDLGENWALCNGEMFDPAEYPALAEVTPSPASLVENKLFRTKALPGEAQSYCEANGYQVITYYSDADANEGTNIAYSTDHFETYKTLHVGLSGLTDGGEQRSIVRYVNGYWIVAHVITNSKIGAITVKYCETLDGEWVVGAELERKGHGRIYDIWFRDGIYYMSTSAGNESTSNGHNYPYIVRSDKPAFTNAVASQLNTTSKTVYGFVRNDDYCVFVRASSKSAGEVIYTPASNPLMATAVSFSFAGATLSSTLNGATLTYINGYYVIASEAYLIYTNNITATSWNVTPLPVHADAPIGYARGCYFVACHYLHYDGTPPSTTASTAGIMVGTDITSSDGWQFVYCGNTDGSSNPIPTPRIVPVVSKCSIDYFCDDGVVAVPVYAVPVSDPAPMYEYIKVKEDN